MNYEQKYKELAGKIKKAYLYAQTDSTIAVLEDILPELAESEDEKIRKALKRAIAVALDYSYFDKVTADNCIAWLEKQGEKTQQTPQWMINFLNENRSKFAYSMDDYDEQREAGGKLDAIIDWLEKQGEKKSVDKVEPRFEVGDYVVTDYIVGKIFAVTDDSYLLDTGQGIPFSSNNVHLWTIKDAKPCDVLVDVYGNIGIYKKCNDYDWTSYCSLGCNGGFQSFSVPHENDKTHPATKGQRDTLFAEMREAGYEWDAKNKELKNTETIGGEE